MNGEFDIIKRYFAASNRMPRKDVILSIGDDCAVTELRPNQRLAITTDTMVEGIHFYPDISPADLAHKAVASNLSDLAAMGAEPAWISLALTLPKIDHQWLAVFSQSLFQILDHYNVDLIGGDTTRGTLSVTITAQGILPKGHELCRHNAKPGDWIYVSGTLGDSAAGLALLTQSAVSSEQEYLVQRHLRPTPRVLLGLALSTGLATAAIDISDGLSADLGHILSRSQVGAIIHLEQLPLSDPLLRQVGREQAEQLALTGGEDYELCFTVSQSNRAKMEKALANIGVPVTCIGQIRASKQHNIIYTKLGKTIESPQYGGFDHFK